MIDFILFSFFIGTAYLSFRAGAKYGTIKKAGSEFLEWVKSIG